MTGPFPPVEPESLPDPWCFVKRSRPPLGFCRTFSVRLPVKRYIQHEKYFKGGNGFVSCSLCLSINIPETEANQNQVKIHKKPITVKKKLIFPRPKAQERA